jgi:hypothetical protein
MKKYLAALVVTLGLIAFHSDVMACDVRTYFINGRTIVCTICGSVTNCNG